MRLVKFTMVAYVDVDVHSLLSDEEELRRAREDFWDWQGQAILGDPEGYEVELEAEFCDA